MEKKKKNQIPKTENFNNIHMYNEQGKWITSVSLAIFWSGLPIIPAT